MTDTALVLVGGEGTRLRPLTLTQPKPALRLVDRPFIRFMLDWLRRHGVTEVVMACGFGAQAVRAALGERVPGGPRLRYLEERKPLGTAGPVRLAADEGLVGERFLVLNGDVLTDLDLTELVRQHERHSALATIALYPVEDPSHYGLVTRTEEGEVLEFLEKPEPGEISTDEINAGAYVLERAVAEEIPPDQEVSIEREVFPRLVGRGLYGQRLDGYWLDIGTPERYLQATWDILEGRVSTDLEASDEGVLVDAGVSVDPEAKVGPRAVVGAGSVIGPGAAVRQSVLLGECRIGGRARVEASILAAGVEVGEGATVEAGSVLGAGARVAPGASVGPGARVAPGEVAG